MIKSILKKILIMRYKKKYCPGYSGAIGIDIKNCRFEQFVYVAHHAQMMNSFIGNHSSIGRFDKIRDSDIGKYCCFSWDCTIGAPTHPFKTVTNCSITYRREYGMVDKDIAFPQKRTTIGNDVWVGCDVTVMSGVTIGNGAIVGAGAVVTKDIPMYEIWAGVPAKKIGQRFPDEIISRVDNLKWWDWCDKELKMCQDLFSQDLDLKITEELENRHNKFF